MLVPRVANRRHVRRWLWSLACGLAAGTNCCALTIRDDVPDADYVARSAAAEFSASGAVSYYANANPGNVFWCSGTLVHPEWVLTSAHCTIESSAWTYTFYQGPDRSNPESTVGVDTRFRNPTFNVSNPAQGNDFGLLHLSTPVTDIIPTRMYRSPSGELSRPATVVGYGQTGTGVTGANPSLPNGIRRAMENSVDALGTLFSGGTAASMVTDFDSIAPGNNAIGSAVPLPLEGNVALNDSGGGWFQTINGVQYLTGVTSFRAATDGTDNSDYGDLSGASRTSQSLSWIDTNYDRTLFWNAANGSWNQAGLWYGGIEPTEVSAAVIDQGTVQIVNPGETAKYTYVAGTGQLVLSQSLSTLLLRLSDQGTVEANGTISLSGDLQQAGGTLQFELRGASPGLFDQLVIANDAVLNGDLSILTAAAYAGPAGRGATDRFALVQAGSISGTPAAIRFDGNPITASPTYVGATHSGLDGLFASYRQGTTEGELTTYLALPGDANGDGSVDGSDFSIWNSNKFLTGTDWVSGDFNGDGTTDGSDFSIWNTYKFTTVVDAARTVPEPAGCLVALLGPWWWRRHAGRRRPGD